MRLHDSDEWMEISIACCTHLAFLWSPVFCPAHFFCTDLIHPLIKRWNGMTSVPNVRLLRFPLLMETEIDTRFITGRCRYRNFLRCYRNKVSLLRDDLCSVRAQGRPAKGGCRDCAWRYARGHILKCMFYENLCHEFIFDTNSEFNFLTKTLY